MKIYTIGFTRKSAQEFFDLLSFKGIERVVDIRVHPGGQLAGFAKYRDLAYFLKELANIDYVYLPELAPTDELMKDFRAEKDMAAYEAGYRELLEAHRLPKRLDRAMFEEKACCLLGSEADAAHCHRRIAAEIMREEWGDVEIIHL